MSDDAGVIYVICEYLNTILLKMEFGGHCSVLAAPEITLHMAAQKDDGLIVT